MLEGARTTAGRWARDPGFRVGALFLLLAAVPRLWAVAGDDSVVYADEIFQTVEQAHRAVFGYGLVPWEFRYGARSWLFPGLLAGALRGGDLLGVETGPGLLHVAKAAMALLSLAGCGAAMRLAWVRGGTRAAALTGAMCAAFPPLLVFGSRCATETASGPLLVVAALLLFGARAPSRRAAVAAGVLVGAAVFFRYQNGLEVILILGILAAARRWRDALAAASGMLTVALLAGVVLDSLTWGSPFRSFVVYYGFNVLEHGSANFGEWPWWWYATTLAVACGPAAGLVALGLAAGARRHAPLVVMAVGYAAALSAVGHKEIRFLLPVAYVALAAGGLGLAEAIGWVGALRERAALGRGVVGVACAALAAAFAVRSARLTYDEFGYPGDEHSIWHQDEGATRLLGVAGDRPELCGLVLMDIFRGSTGGYTVLHREVPFLIDTEPDALASANAIVAHDTTEPPPGYARVAAEGGFALFERSGGCAAPPKRFTSDMGPRYVPRH